MNFTVVFLKPSTLLENSLLEAGNLEAELSDIIIVPFPLLSADV
jgi:hypothetical protein